MINIKEKIIYYTDELNDDFAGIKRKTIEIDSKFPFIRDNTFYKIAAFFVYRIIMTPIAYVYCKLKFNIKFKGKEVLKAYKKSGYFLYGNHTQIPADGYFPIIITFPKKTSFIVHPDNVSKKGTKTFMQMIGAIPLPTTIKGFRNFADAVERRVLDGGCVVVYPEAHIWPYYTQIRPFTSNSFVYPTKFSQPAFCFTVTYQKRIIRKIPKMTVYIDGPFFPDENTTLRNQPQNLRDKIYNKMCERAKNSNYSLVKYIKKDEDNL